MNIPSNHPRAKSLYIRELLVTGFRNGLVAPEGLIAHGRGEAFDYLLGEHTTKAARDAANAASSMLLLSKYPVISVNGNVTALCAKGIIELSHVTGAAIEVNLFYRTTEREMAIEKELKKNKAKTILGIGSEASMRIPELQSERRRVDPNGIYKADTLLVPLEDGDRAEALVNMGKTVITIDLNPLSRTAKVAHITIVDNIIRAIPEMIVAAKQLKEKNASVMKRIVEEFDNKANLAKSLNIIRGDI
ncbi:MAG: phosphopantothenate/pantothenate synthetase [Nitrososphaeraceae archaeon]|nr:phosphopantothenate/pantothenate synthetase [Nitrososphaeraceae archaeon]MBV9666814.1 phosphopantothenate/pantothenate synthetase [Nitrososphaeraceae archaeon]